MDVEKWVQEHTQRVYFRDRYGDSDYTLECVDIADLRELLKGRILCDAEPVAYLSVDCIGERFLGFSPPNDNDECYSLITTAQAEAYANARVLALLDRIAELEEENARLREFLPKEYAGVAVWIGDRRAIQVSTKHQVEAARMPMLRVMFDRVAEAVELPKPQEQEAEDGR